MKFAEGLSRMPHLAEDESGDSPVEKALPEWECLYICHDESTLGGGLFLLALASIAIDRSMAIKDADGG